LILIVKIAIKFILGFLEFFTSNSKEYGE